jgi:hypothetical protein
MCALPPTKTCRDKLPRVSPSTDEMRIGPGTAGMWHDWQLRRSFSKSLCCHSW